MDQLDPSHQGRQLGWMPASLPEHVKFILSTLEEEKYECFPALKFLYPDQSNYIAVEKLPEGDVKSIIDSWFKEKHRTLTTYQMDLLIRSFDQCPLPLNLKLSFDEACRWTSFAAQDTTRLQTTIRASINRLFFRLERQHGELFVSRTLGYITAGVLHVIRFKLLIFFLMSNATIKLSELFHDRISHVDDLFIYS